MRYTERLRREIGQVGTDLDRTPPKTIFFISCLALLVAATMTFGGLHL